VQPIRNRWYIAAVCTVLMVCLGTVYAWSFFQKLLADSYGWSNSQVAWAFSLAICCLGLAAAVGGVLLPKVGPTRLALAGAVLFASGYLLAALALSYRSLALLYLGYGLLGGTGLGLGYVTPVTTVAKWFPDRKGFATGLVVMGFGLGALLMSKIIAPFLLQLFPGNLPAVFAALGALFLLVTVPVAVGISDPPPGWQPPAAVQQTVAAVSASTDSRIARDCILSVEFVLLWLLFFCNIVAGIAIIGFQSPLFQDICSRAGVTSDPVTLARHGATLIAVSSLFNGVGRFFWGGVSDRIGRLQTFRLLLGTQLVAFLLLMQTSSPWIFFLLVCYILLCYGGGFGTMPSFILDRFGHRLMPAVYGTILTAWSAGGIAGPQMVALIKDLYPAAIYPGKAATISFAIGACFLLLGLTFSFLLTVVSSRKSETG